MAKVIINIFTPAVNSSIILNTPLLSFFPKSFLHNTAIITRRIFTPNQKLTRILQSSFSSPKHSTFFHNTSKVDNKLFSVISKNSVSDNISSFQIKKRPVRKRKLSEDEGVPGQYNAVAYATADEYMLESLVEGLKKQDLYVPNVVDNLDDVVHAVARYRVDSEPREIFFFREGSVVFWNVSELESSNVLAFLKDYEQKSYNDKMIQAESEHMNYTYSQPG